MNPIWHCGVIGFWETVSKFHAVWDDRKQLSPRKGDSFTRGISLVEIMQVLFVSRKWRRQRGRQNEWDKRSNIQIRIWVKGFVWSPCLIWHKGREVMKRNDKCVFLHIYFTTRTIRYVFTGWVLKNDCSYRHFVPRIECCEFITNDSWIRGSE